MEYKFEWVDPEIKVTRIGKNWHARMFLKGKIIDEMACQYRQDIGYICRTMMRWHDKCGGMSRHAISARRRHTEKDSGPVGRVWKVF